MMWLDLALMASQGNYTISYEYASDTYVDRYAVDQGYLYSQTNGFGLALLDSYRGDEQVAYRVTLDTQGNAHIGTPYAETDAEGNISEVTSLTSYAPLSALASIETSPLEVLDGQVYSDDETFLSVLLTAAGFGVLMDYGLVDGVYITADESAGYAFSFTYVLTENNEVLLQMLGLDANTPLMVTLTDIGTTTIQTIAEAVTAFTVPAAIDTSVDPLYLEDDSGTVSFNLYEVMIDPSTSEQTPSLAATGTTSWSENTLDIVTELYGSTSGYYFSTEDGTSVTNSYIDAGTGELVSVPQTDIDWEDVDQLFNPTVGFDATGFRASGETDQWISYDTGITDQITQMTGITTGVPYSYVTLNTSDPTTNSIHAESDIMYDSSTGAYFAFVAEIEISALESVPALTAPAENTEFVSSFITGKLDGTAPVHISSEAGDLYGYYAFPSIDTYFDGDDTLLTILSSPAQAADGSTVMEVEMANAYRYNAETQTLENFTLTAGADGAITAVHDAEYDIPLTAVGGDLAAFMSSMLVPVSPNILTLAQADDQGASYYIPYSGHVSGYQGSNLANLGYLAMAAAQGFALLDGSTLTAVTEGGYLTAVQYAVDAGTGLDTYETLYFTYGEESLDETFTTYAAALDALSAEAAA